mmetsp:Transcript_34868/g.74340  ORF Transcript_34868/g.74340 Transcript_34868/m.74340 type:complete len:328 (+) Transcript_34868:370-1353(+)
MRGDGILPHGGGEAHPSRALPGGVRDGRGDAGHGHAHRRGPGDDPHHVADSRRPPLHGQRRPPTGQADVPRHLRRGRRHPRRGLPPQHVLRARRPRDAGGEGVPRQDRRRHRPARRVRRSRGTRGRAGHGPRVRGEAGHDPRRPEVDTHPQDRHAAAGGGGVRGGPRRRDPRGGGRVREVRDGHRARLPGRGRHTRRHGEQRGPREDGREGRGHRQDDVREAHGAGGEQEVRAGADRRGEGVPGAVRGEGGAAAGDRGLHRGSKKLGRGYKGWAGAKAEKRQKGGKRQKGRRGGGVEACECSLFIHRAGPSARDPFLFYSTPRGRRK